MQDATLPMTAPVPVPGLASPAVAEQIQPHAIGAGGTPAAPAVSDPSAINFQPSTRSGSTAPPPNADLCAPTSPSAVSLAPAPGESPRAFAAFCGYLELGPRRRYSTVAREAGVSVRTIERWAIQFDWRERLTTRVAQGTEQVVQTREAGLLETAAREQSLRERQLVLAESIVNLTERYFERLDDMDLEHVRLPDVCRALEIASRLVGPAREPAPAAAADQGLRDQLTALLDQAFRDQPKPNSP